MEDCWYGKRIAKSTVRPLMLLMKHKLVETYKQHEITKVYVSMLSYRALEHCLVTFGNKQTLTKTK